MTSVLEVSRCIGIKQKIARYREKKTNTIFDDFYRSDLDLLEDLLDKHIAKLEKETGSEGYCAEVFKHKEEDVIL